MMSYGACRRLLPPGVGTAFDRLAVRPACSAPATEHELVLRGQRHQLGGAHRVAAAGQKLCKAPKDEHPAATD